MSRKDEIIAAAVEAACESVFASFYKGRFGDWPEGADRLHGTSADQWRVEEREALLPALDVLEREGVLRWE